MAAKKRTAAAPKKRPKVFRFHLDESLKQFFPKTSRMGVGISTPWEKQLPITRKEDDKLPRLRLPRAAFSTRIF